jgi:ABC-type glutathione transport system ATPase component
LLSELDDGRVTVLATTHDPALIEAASDRLDLTSAGTRADHQGAAAPATPIAAAGP